MSRRRNRRVNRAGKRGMAPGSAVYTGDRSEEPVDVAVFDYTEARLHETSALGLQGLAARRGTDSVTWVNLDGIHRVEHVQQVCQCFGVHPLWIEDILNPHGAAKAEGLGDQLLVITKECRLGADGLDLEQISFVLGPGFVLTFQEEPGDVWDAVRNRLRVASGRIRRMDASYLLHALLDAVVDQYFVILESLEGRVDEIEFQAIEDPDLDVIAQVHALRREITQFRQVVWPMREATVWLAKGESTSVSDASRPFFRDLYDHVALAMDVLDASRERLVGVIELHLARSGQRLNEIMRILTVVSTIFIPLTFVVGVYGMNFEFMPELHSHFGYPAVMLGMAGLAVGMALWFRSRRWW